jgi:rod shape-determining protein MreD
MTVLLVALLAVVYLAAMLETSLADALRVGAVGPDLMALVAIIWVLRVPGARTFLAAGLVGLASDLIAPGRLGLAMATFLLIGYLVTRLKSKLHLEKPLCQVPTVLVAGGLSAAAIGVGCRVLGETSLDLSTLLGRAAGVGVYNAGLSVPLIMILAWTKKPSLHAP